MPTLYVRNVPTKLYRRIQSLAESERRSLSAEVLTLLEQAISDSPSRPESTASILERIRARRDAIERPPNRSGSAASIREGRAERAKRVSGG